LPETPTNFNHIFWQSGNSFNVLHLKKSNRRDSFCQSLDLMLFFSRGESAGNKNKSKIVAAGTGLLILERGKYLVSYVKVYLY
jgi:hypothetical protein